MPILHICLWCLAAFVVSCNSGLIALDRPEWMDRPGIIIAGNWEEPCFRARLMGRTDYTLPPDKQAEYAQEHSPEMIARLKDLGVNFLMIHCYKGAGMKTEREGLDDAKRFAQLAHRSGLRVGTYIGGTLLFERLFDEEPNARQWQALAPDGHPIPYPAQKFRRTSVRNHPGFIEYLKKPVRFAIEDMQAELIHFDNFCFGAASYDPFSKEQFREFLKSRGKTPADPPDPKSPDSPLVHDWQQYKCRALANHYAAMSQYIRSLNPKCAVECNPDAVGNGEMTAQGVDHARLLPLGNAYWDENFRAGWSDKENAVRTRIRSLKVGELFNNSTFLYCESAIELAESMAFNVNCLGAVAWFEWGKIASSPINPKPPCKELKTYTRFFLDHQDLFRHWPAVADVAVLRTFADQCRGPRDYFRVEQGLIEGHAAWRIIYDEYLDRLDGYRALIVPDDAWLSADQRQKIADFAQHGGLVVRSSEISRPNDFPRTIQDRLRVRVDAPRWVALEVRQQSRPRRVLVHLVNYNAAQSAKNVPVKLRVHGGAPKSVRLFSPDPAMDEAIPFESNAEGCSFVVPELKVYAAILIDGAAL
jgi:hypothetical protein